jgi:hypothetical protein
VNQNIKDKNSSPNFGLLFLRLHESLLVHNFTLHHCSSGNYSPDGVAIKEAKVALLNRTTPHAVDPKNPGAAII